MDRRPGDEHDRLGALSRDRPCGLCGHPGAHELMACDTDTCDCNASDHT